MLTRAFRWLDAVVMRLSTLSARILVWPAIYAVALGSALWGMRNKALLAGMANNKVAQPERIQGVLHVAAAAGALLVVYLLANVVVRVRRGEFRFVETTAKLNRALSFVMAAPLVLALRLPKIENSHPLLVIAYCALAAGVCVPSFSMLARAVPLDDAREFSASERREKTLRRLTWLLLGVMFLAYGLFFSRLAITNHHAFVTRTIDLGYYDNIFYQSIHGRPLACSFLKEGGHWSAHFDPILVVLSPLYLLYPRAEMLLTLQSFWLAFGVFPAFLLGRKLLDSRVAGLVCGALYLLHPALHGANLYEFHSLTLVAMPVLWALYFLEIGAKKRYWATLVVLLLIREDVPLLMCFVGVHAILSRRPGMSRLGWVTIVICLSYFVLVKSVFMTSSDLLNSGKGAYGFEYYFRDMIPNRTGVRGLATSLLTNPVFVLKHAFSEKKITFLLQLAVPLAMLPLLARSGKVILIYGMAFLLLASRKAVYSTHFQYAMIMLPVLVALAPKGLRRLRDGRAPGLLGMRPEALTAGMLGAMLVCSALMSWKFGGIVRNASFRGGFSRVAHELPPDKAERYAKIRELIDQIEPGAGVTVTNITGPHLSNRQHVYLYRQRKVKESHYVFVDTRDLRKMKGWHERRIKRRELQLIGGWKTMKLYRFHPEFEHADAKAKTDKAKADKAKAKAKADKAKADKAKAAQTKAKSKAGAKANSNGKTDEIEDDRGAEQEP